MIRLSTKGRYATRIMIYLAAHNRDQPATTQEIAEGEHITSDYVVQILMRLKTAGLVESRRGVKGGFVLARDPADITVADVLEATEGTIQLVACDDDEPCQWSSQCVTRKVWDAANDALQEVFASRTIGQLANERLQLAAAGALMFHI